MAHLNAQDQFALIFDMNYMKKFYNTLSSNFFPLIVIVINVLNIFYIVQNSTPVDRIDYVSLITESIVVTLPLFGIFISNKMLKEEPYVFAPLFIGLSLLTISTVTDALDELFNEPALENVIFEQLCEVLGLFLMLLSLSRWLKYSHNLNNKLYELAHTDELTGAANRRRFISALEAEISRSKRYSKSFSVISFDVDHFKTINDTYGHDMGDEVLKNIYQIINTQIRNTDLLARTGGEEFAILLINSDISEAKKIAEKCRLSLINSHPLMFGVVTASFGVVQFDINQSVATLLKKADSALYRAKENGRNCVEVVI